MFDDAALAIPLRYANEFYAEVFRQQVEPARSLRTNTSLLLVVIAHMGAYLNNTSTALPNALPLAMHTLGYCVFALALLSFDREAWRVRGG